MLDYKGIKVSAEGEMIDELPIILIIVKYRGNYFKPKKDMLISGVITQISESHINLLCFGVFNTIIHRN